MNRQQSVARLITELVVREPALWRLFRERTRRLFDGSAPTWEARLGPQHLEALLLALEEVEPPAHALDLGTGTGVAAKAVAERFPSAKVTGVDLSPGMLEEAERRLPAELAGRVSFTVADAAALPFPDGACELVTLMNMIPFFAELARVTAPRGTVVLSFSRGAETPIYVPPDRLERELRARGFTQFASFSAGPATALRAARR